MSAPAFTPGPWMAGTSAPLHVFTANGEAIAACNPVWNGSAVANASLIAAGPEMYEALKAFHCMDCDDGILLSDSIFFDIDRENDKQPCPHCRLIVPAIAKAEGRA